MKRKITAVFDTETTGTLSRPLVYDLGVVITNKQGKILEKKRWIIDEIFNSDKMKTAYYSWKIPTHYQELEKITVPFYVAIAEFRKILVKHDVSIISAYNMGFDIRAMANTYNELIAKPLKLAIISKPNEPKWKIDFEETFRKRVIKNVVNFKPLCLWSYACEVILNSKNYREMAYENNWLTERGNYLTNAEVTTRYLTKDVAFEEQHTALDDALIESYILHECEKRKKKHKSGILYNPWRLVQE